MQLPIWDVHYYHLFLPIESQKEVNTEFLFSKILQKNKKLVVSKSNFETHSMEHFLWSKTTQITKNAYGIPEPSDGIAVKDQEIEVVFVPLLAYDKKGNRLGYGKGFYDRFLSACKQETIKIGLSFFEAETALIDNSENDVRLDYCITPKRVYSF